MNQKEYERLKRKIEEESQKKLNAIEMVWEMSGSPAAKQTKRLETPQRAKRGFLSKAVKEVLSILPDEFVPWDVEKLIFDKFPELQGTVKSASLSSTLKRMADDGEIKIVELGAGKRATRYTARQLVGKTN